MKKIILIALIALATPVVQSAQFAKSELEALGHVGDLPGYLGSRIEGVDLEGIQNPNSATIEAQARTINPNDYRIPEGARIISIPAVTPEAATLRAQLAKILSQNSSASAAANEIKAILAQPETIALVGIDIRRNIRDAFTEKFHMSNSAANALLGFPEEIGTQAPAAQAFLNIRPKLPASSEALIKTFITTSKTPEEAAKNIRMLVNTQPELRIALQEDILRRTIAHMLRDKYPTLDLVLAQQILALDPIFANGAFYAGLIMGKSSDDIESILHSGMKPTYEHLRAALQNINNNTPALVKLLLDKGARIADAPNLLATAFLSTNPASAAVFSELIQRGGYKFLDEPDIGNAVHQMLMLPETEFPPQAKMPEKIAIYNAAKEQVTAAQTILEKLITITEDDDLSASLAHIVTAINQGASLRKVNPAILETLMQNLWNSDKPESAKLLALLLENKAPISWSLYGKAKVAGLSKDPLTQAKVTMINFYNKLPKK